VGAVSPSSTETIFISVQGKALPMVDTRNSIGSSGADMVTTGALSVCPYPMVNSAQRISHITRFMTSTGHGAPAIIPVRRLDKSYDLKSGNPSSAMNMAGTP
jgi:hypothetical protein